jgi:hypothetical protein
MVLATKAAERPIAMDASNISSVPADAAERAARFVGRRRLLHQVADWIAAERNRYLLIIGEPGSGKTAFASWLAGAGPIPDAAGDADVLRHVRSRLDAVHFCIARGQRGAVNPGEFIRLLAKRLARRSNTFATAAISRVAPGATASVEVGENWGTVIGIKIDKLIVASADPEDVYHRIIREPLRAIAEADPAMRVLVMVDALDEALTADAPNIVSLLAGSRDIPGLRFLATSRDEPRVIDQFDDAAIIRLSDDTAMQADEDLRLYVAERMAGDERLQSAMAGSTGAVLDWLVERSAGNFLYATFVLDEIATAQRAVSDLDTLPRGLNDMYRMFLDRLFLSPTRMFAEPWLDRYEPILGSLAVAEPAAPEAVLPGWLGWSRNELNARLHDVSQLVEYLPEMFEGSGGYRLYHRSIADFLAAYRYRHNGSWRKNEYYVEPAHQNRRIAAYYLSRIEQAWAGDWTRCDTYGLEHLVGHLKAREQLSEESSAATRDEFYRTALDGGFQDAQHDRLGIDAVLSDLRSTLDFATARPGLEDVVPMLRCVADFRRNTKSTRISTAIFDAVDAARWSPALELAGRYGIGPQSRGGWMQILQLYVAWEAAQAGQLDDARRAVKDAGPYRYPAVQELAVALLGHVARSLPAQGGGQSGPLEDLGWPGSHDPWLRMSYTAPELSREELQGLIDDLTPQVRRLESISATRAEAASARTFIDDRNTLMVDPETASDLAGGLRNRLLLVAAEPQGQQLTVRALQAMMRNPYPRYRDIGLSALGTAVLASPDIHWMRFHLRRLLAAGLDDEGVAFSFDLPAALLAECERRGRSVPGLEEYLTTALAHVDPWGTRMRARSALAGARFSRGDVAGAFEALVIASTHTAQYAGYGVMAVLSLVERCSEFGEPARAWAPIWGPDGRASLLDLARDAAGRVYDPVFAEERRALVEAYARWIDEAPPDIQTARKRLSEITDLDMRGALQRFIAARWAAEYDTSMAELKELVPFALFDTTTLDAVLARLLGRSLSSLSDAQLSAVLALTESDFSSGRPWSFGQWR